MRDESVPVMRAAPRGDGCGDDAGDKGKRRAGEHTPLRERGNGKGDVWFGSVVVMGCGGDGYRVCGDDGGVSGR